MTRTEVGIIRNQRGFGLVEVLVAVLVLSAALLALGKFQSDLLQGGRSAKARAIAAELVQEKLDDLRSFSQLSTGSGTIVFGYSDIANNVGGTKVSSGVNVVEVFPVVDDSSLSLSGVDFSRTWLVEDWWYCDDNNIDVFTPKGGSSCNGGTDPYSDYKVVTLTVAWTEPDGTAASIEQAGTIYAADPKASGHALAVNYHDPLEYSPNKSLGDESIDMGDGNKKITYLPIVETDGASTVITINEEVYHKDGSVSESSFVTVNCNCKLSPNAQGYPPVQQIISGDYVASGDEYVIPSARGKVSKQSGAVVSGDQQSGLCVACCRDHHDVIPANISQIDPNTMVDPFLPISSDSYDTSADDHKHFKFGAKSHGKPIWGLTISDGQDDPYVEACRFKVIGNIGNDIGDNKYLMQDWNLVKVTVMPADHLNKASNLQSYQSYVWGFIQDYVQENSSNNPNYPEVQYYPPPSGTLVWDETDTDSMHADEEKQYQVRGIYIDYMDSEIRSLIASGATIPTALFHEINLTYLADWGLILSPGSATATVTNELLENNSTYSRGIVSGSSGFTGELWAELEHSNTGLTNTVQINKDEEKAKWNMRDSLGINMDSHPMIRGTLRVAADTVGLGVGLGDPVDLQDINLTPLTGVGTCVIREPAGEYKYACLFSDNLASGASGVSGTIIFSDYTVDPVPVGDPVNRPGIRKLCLEPTPPEYAGETVLNNNYIGETTSIAFANVQQDGISMNILVSKQGQIWPCP